MEVRIASCPLGAKCEEVREVNDEQVMFRCPWFTHIRGKEPQSDNDVDKWECAIQFLPMLLIENAQMSRGTQVAVESLRNEMVKGQNNFLSLIQRKREQIQGR